MNICIVFDEDSWIFPFVLDLETKLKKLGHFVTILNTFDSTNCYDIVFMLSYSKIVPEYLLRLNKNNIVVHESALPNGKGWSPLTWQILDGKNEIPITLFEASSAIDSGNIYIQDVIRFNGSELIDELHNKQGNATVSLCIEFVSKYTFYIEHAKQQKGYSSYYRKRIPADSELDINDTIKNQFNLLRVVDNKRYPAFFLYEGERFYLYISKEKK